MCNVINLCDYGVRGVEFDDSLCRGIGHCGSGYGFLLSFATTEGFHHAQTQSANNDDRNAPLQPTFSIESFTAKGAVLLGDALEHKGPLALVELQNGDPKLVGNEPVYLAGTQNFYAITRYNWSSYYALSVIHLGQEVADARQKLR